MGPRLLEANLALDTQGKKDLAFFKGQSERILANGDRLNEHLWAMVFRSSLSLEER